VCANVVKIGHRWRLLADLASDANGTMAAIDSCMNATTQTKRTYTSSTAANTAATYSTALYSAAKMALLVKTLSKESK
jgi:hypothetical protein